MNERRFGETGLARAVVDTVEAWTKRLLDLYAALPDYVGQAVILAVLGWLAARLWRQVVRMAPEIAATRAADELFDGSVEVLNRSISRQKADGRAIDDFYNGAPLKWSLINSGAAIERDQKVAIVEQLRTPPCRLVFFLIAGRPGVGKSTLAWDVAWTLRAKHGFVVAHLKRTSNSAAVWDKLRRFKDEVRRAPLCIVVDDVLRDEAGLAALKQLDTALPVTILATSQTHEVDLARFPVVPMQCRLGAPTEPETSKVRQRLSERGIASNAAGPEKVQAVDKAPDDFLVLMMESTQGGRFGEIVEVSLRVMREKQPELYRIYEYLAFCGSVGLAVPSTLVERLSATGMGANLPDRGGALDRVFWADDFRDSVRVCHPVRAGAERQCYEKDRPSVYVLRRLLEVVEDTNLVHRRFISTLIGRLAISKDPINVDISTDDRQRILTLIAASSSITELGAWHRVMSRLRFEPEAHSCFELALARPIIDSSDCDALVGLARHRMNLVSERDLFFLLDERAESGAEWTMSSTAYLSLVRKHGTVEQRRAALTKARSWLDKNPDDMNVRNTVMSLMESVGTPEQHRELIDETAQWLAANPDIATVREQYLSLVTGPGSDAQVSRAVQTTAAWLHGHPDNTAVRAGYLRLIRCRWLSKANVEQLVRQQEEWAAEHLQQHSVVLSLLATLKELGHWQRAADLVQSAQAANPDNVTIAIQYVELVLGSHDDADEATRLFQGLKSAVARSPGVNAAWARTLCRLDRETEALAIIDGMNYQGNDIHVLHSFGRICLSAGRFGQAEQYLRNGLRIHPGDPQMRRTLAMVLLGTADQLPGGATVRAGELRRIAEDELRLAIEWAQKNNLPSAPIFATLGDFYLERRRWQDARRAFSDALALEPDDYHNHLGSAQALMGMESWAAAERSLTVARSRSASAVDPEVVATIDQLIETCREKNRQALWQG